MPRILFTHSYFLKFDPKQYKLQQPYAPLGTITAAAYLRENGYQVGLHDSMFCDGPEDIIPVINKTNPDYLVIYDDGFNYLTKMCLTNMREAAFKLIETGKQFGCKVIISSSDATDHCEEYFKHGADFIIRGEAELTLLNLVKLIDNGDPNYKSIQGIYYSENGEILKTGTRLVMHDLDSLPMAAWDLINIEAYKSSWLKKYGYFSINMATTRGCPYKCNWCAKPIYGNRYNTRSPENVVNELVYLQENIGFDRVWFCDDIFGLKPDWVKEFGLLSANKGLKFRYKMQSRADLLLKGDTLEYLALSGCEIIWMGVESGSQKILDAMDKGIKVEQVYEVTKRIKALDMKPAFFLQFGYLGETKKDIAKTINMLLDLMPYDIGISVSYPLPGTKFYENVKNELSRKTNWTDSDDLAMMFQNTYQTGYYRLLHRTVHKKFRKKQALNAIRDIMTQFKRPASKSLYKAASALYYIPMEALSSLRLKWSRG